MEAATVALVSQAGQSIFSGMSSYQQGKITAKQNEINQQIARTRALQADAAARDGLEDELSSMRAVFSANDAKMNSANLGLLNRVREIRERERRINVNNERQRGDDYGRRAKAARASGKMGLLGGIAGAGSSLFELYNEVR